MRRASETVLSDIPVMCLPANDGPAGASAAFKALEDRAGGLKGRRFYGTFHRGEYRACVEAAPGEEAAALGLEAGVIPGGSYASVRLYDWRQKINEIHVVFAGLAAGHVVDELRPSVEFYRSERELVCLLPIRS